MTLRRQYSRGWLEGRPGWARCSRGTATNNGTLLQGSVCSLQAWHIHGDRTQLVGPGRHAGDGGFPDVLAAAPARCSARGPTLRPGVYARERADSPLCPTPGCERDGERRPHPLAPFYPPPKRSGKSALAGSFLLTWLDVSPCLHTLKATYINSTVGCGLQRGDSVHQRVLAPALPLPRPAAHPWFVCHSLFPQKWIPLRERLTLSVKSRLRVDLPTGRKILEENLRSGYEAQWRGSTPIVS